MKKRKSLSIRKSIILGFLITILLSFVCIGSIVFTGWFTSANRTIKSIAEDLNERIYDELYSKILVPEHINEVNYNIIDNGFFDLTDEDNRDKYFVGVLSSYEKEIYSFSFGTVDGEYFGAIRNEDGVIDIVRSNAETGGDLWSYKVKDDMTAGEISNKAGKFDPRRRAWFTAAVRHGHPTYSPIYKHFTMNDLTISYASPVYDENGKLFGVLGTHMLLTELTKYLEDAVSKYSGYAILVEKDTNMLIANSAGVDNYIILRDGAIERQHFKKINNASIQEAYDIYLKNQGKEESFSGKIDNHYINVKEIKNEGLNWVIISAIPEEILIKPVVNSLYISLALAAMILLLAIFIYLSIAAMLLRPMNSLLKVSEAMAGGDLTERVPITRNDEIGRISEVFNNVADRMYYLISNLEAAVKERTEELSRLNRDLEENKEKLQLLLDSTAEAIYGIDLEGRCTFCNKSTLRLLGYDSQDELLGKNMHTQIHHSHRDGSPINIDDCKILKTILQGNGIESEDEVFWRKDGTFLDVEYHSYPQIKDGKVIGGVVTFMDITERKQREEKIRYLSSHDILTGFHNRRSFEESRTRIDTPENLPLSVIYADINGLKMTNDIFGHAAGDKLITETADILRRSCREEDLVARVGGDEFIILMPGTDSESAGRIIENIRMEFVKVNEHTKAIKCSISLGYGTKTNPGESLDEIISIAENAMYKDKAINQKSINTDMAGAIIDALHLRSSYEKQHSMEVSKLCGEIGAYMKLSEFEINQLIRAGYLHDIGKITFNDRLLSLKEHSMDEKEELQQHVIVGYRILNLFDDTLDLAEYVYSHHEHWDGSGYPRGLKGDQIPLLARIIAIAESYSRKYYMTEGTHEEKKAAALQKIKDGSGKRFDPEIVKLFIRMMEEKDNE